MKPPIQTSDKPPTARQQFDRQPLPKDKVVGEPNAQGAFSGLSSSATRSAASRLRSGRLWLLFGVPAAIAVVALIFAVPVVFTVSTFDSEKLGATAKSFMGMATGVGIPSDPPRVPASPRPRVSAPPRVPTTLAWWQTPGESGRTANAGGSEPRPGTTLEARRQQIAEMTAAQRRRLELNFETYRQLSDEERRNIDALHQTVEQDSSLRELMYEYTEWLKTLSPWEREELRKETDPAARVELVRQFKEEQERKHIEQSLDSPGSAGFDRRGFASVSPADLAAVLQVMEDALPRETVERLDSRSGLPRYLAILDAHLTRQRSSRSSLMLSEELTDRMIAAISNKELREKLAESSSLEKRRQDVRWLITRGLWAEWRAEYEKRRPTQEQIYEFHAQLPPHERAEYTSLPPDEAKRRLVHEYMRTQQDESARDDADKFRRVMGRINPPRPPRSGSFGRGGGRSGSRGESRPAPGPRRPREGRDRSPD